MLDILIITIVVLLVVVWPMKHLLKSSDNFWQAAKVAEEQIRKADNAWDAINILKELQKKGWHRVHGERIRELNYYIKGKFNLK